MGGEVRFYKADKKSPGGVKRREFKHAATALKWGYLPSVTTILGVIRTPYIEEYIVRNCLDHYQAYEDYRAALSYRDNEAADFGTVCHALLESHLKGTPCNLESNHLHHQTCGPLWRWIEENIEQVLFCEERFADNELGYSGTADLLVLLRDGRQMLLDLKTKKNSPKYPMEPDMGCRYQLSAYLKHFEKSYGKMGIANLFLASPFGYLPEPRLSFVDYGEGDFFDGFEAAHKLWKEQNLGRGGTVMEALREDSALDRFTWKPGELELIKIEQTGEAER
jgi:hypothetical protein